MLLTAVIIGLVVWAITDSIENYSLKQIFNAKLSERFSWQAEKQRIMFDRYVKGHHQAVKLFMQSQNILEYTSSSDWKNNSQIRSYSIPPPWLPRLSVIRNFFQPRYMLLLDAEGNCHEIYNASSGPAPAELIHPGQKLLNLSHNQGFLTRLKEKPYLLASAYIKNKKNVIQGILLLASPLDEEFLIASQGSVLAGSNVIALLTEDEPSILVSSNPTLIPAGTKTDTLKGKYLKIGQGFFDYGATDIVIELVSFISTAEALQLTREVLNEERPLRSLTAITYVLAFVLLIFIITRRLQNFTNYVVGFSEEMNLKRPEQTNTGDEITILEENFNRLAEAVQNETRALAHQALHDPLTELPNRKLLHNRLQQEILRSKRNSQQLVLIISDLNHFKEINDTLGHHVGDLVLQKTAERLFSIFRKTDTIARLGGDEFAVLLPDTSLEQAKKLAHKVMDDFKIPYIVDGHTLAVHISMGMSEFPSHGDDVNILMQRADIAMYIAKQNKLGFCIYNPDKDTHSIGRLALMSELREAIVEESLEIHYQPKVDMSTGTVTGAEALLRWNHPKRGFIDPDEFIPLAEQTGLIKPVTKWVLKKSIAQVAEWQNNNINIGLSVNLSVHNLHDSKLFDYINEQILRNKLSPEILTLELTESDIMAEPIRAREILNEIKAIGIHLSIDDFGTGYSSLSYIKQLPVDEIKIDRSFVMEMTQEDDGDIIVKATIDLAHNLGLSIVAEGVHNKKIWQRLKELNCDIAQGYYISEPLEAVEFTSWVTSKNRREKVKSC